MVDNQGNNRLSYFHIDERILDVINVKCADLKATGELLDEARTSNFQRKFFSLIFSLKI